MGGKALMGNWREEKPGEVKGGVLKEGWRDGKGSHKEDTGMKRQEGVRKERRRDGT